MGDIDSAGIGTTGERMYALPYLGVIEVTGRDAGKFLQAQLAADIDRLQPGGAGFAGLCQPQGRVLALLLVIRSASDYRLVCANSLRDAVLGRLRPYVLRDDVQLAASDVDVSGAIGEESAPNASSPLPGLFYALAKGTDTVSAAFRAGELARGVAWLDPDHSGVFLPQMLGHEAIGALSYRKGCFPGQEIIARTRYLGRLKQRAVVIRYQGEPLNTGARVTLNGGETQVDAVLVDQSSSPDKGQVALLVARSTEPFEVASLAVDDGAPQATVGQWLEVSSKRPDAA
jgi:folate-binding protein YgfZ